jgi:hypothetical protein
MDSGVLGVLGVSAAEVQIAALRRALGEGRRGERYVATVSGRGYRFVAPVKRQEAFHGQENTAVAPEHNRVSGLIRMLGRDQIIDALIRELPVRRLTTIEGIEGPGGIGKTTVALALANLLKVIATTCASSSWPPCEIYISCRAR